MGKEKGYIKQNRQSSLLEKSRIWQYSFVILFSVLIGIVSSVFFSYQVPDKNLLSIFIALPLLIFLFFIFKKNFIWKMVIFLICWIPLQNFILLITTKLNFPQPVNIFILVTKELVVISLLVCLLFLKKTRMIRIEGVDAIFLTYGALLGFYLIFYLFFSSVPIKGALVGLRALVVPLILYFLGRFIPFDKEKIRHLIILVIFIGIEVSLFEIFLRFLVSETWLAEGISRVNRVKYLPYQGGPKALFYADYGFWATGGIRRGVSTLLDPQIFTYFLNLPIFLLVYLSFCRNNEMRIRFIPLYAFFVIFAQIFLGLGRGGIIATIVGFLIFGLYIRKVRRFLVMAVLPAILFVCLHPVANRMVTSTLSIKDMSAGGHLNSIIWGINLTYNYPLGLGIGHGGIAAAFTPTGTLGSGEGYLFLIVSQVGVIGLCLFVIALAMLVNLSIRGFTKYLKDKYFLRGLSLSIAACTIGYFIGSFFSETPMSFITSGIFWIFSGIIVQQIIKAKKSYKPTDKVK